MPQNSFALMTNIGRAKEAAALANGTTIQITQIAIGDGVTVPSGGEAALYHEVARKPISGHGTVAGANNVAYFDCYLAAADGPYTIYEAGLYDAAGDLIAIAHYDPPINKPVPSSGQTIEGTVRLEVAFGNAATVLISVDPSMVVALQRLSRLPWIPVIELYRNDPPAAPAPGDAYVIGTTPTGAWAGNAGKVAEYTVAGWAMIAPPAGHGVSLPTGKVYIRVDGTYVEKIAADAQSGKWVYSEDTGAADAAILTLNPFPYAGLRHGMQLLVKFVAPNQTTAPKVASIVNSGYADIPIVKKNGLAPAIGDMSGFVPLIFDTSSGSGRFRVNGLVISDVATSTAFRPRITGPLNLYVATTGSDSNNGLTPATPFLTPQRAANYAVTLDTGGYTITVNVANGSYSGAGVIVPAPMIGGGSLLWKGNSANPAAVQINNTQAAGNTAAFDATGAAQIIVDGFTVSSAYGPGLFAQGAGSVISYANMVFSNCINGNHVQAFGGGQCLAQAGIYEIRGNAQCHFAASQGGTIYNNAGQINLQIIGNITFSSTFASASVLSSLRLPAMGFTITGSFASPYKYSVAENSVLSTNGGYAGFPSSGGASSVTTGGTVT